MKFIRKYDPNCIVTAKRALNRKKPYSCTIHCPKIGICYFLY